MATRSATRPRGVRRSVAGEAGAVGEPPALRRARRAASRSRPPPRGPSAALPSPFTFRPTRRSSISAWRFWLSLVDDADHLGHRRAVVRGEDAGAGGQRHARRGDAAHHADALRLEHVGEHLRRAARRVGHRQAVVPLPAEGDVAGEAHVVRARLPEKRDGLVLPRWRARPRRRARPPSSPRTRRRGSRGGARSRARPDRRPAPPAAASPPPGCRRRRGPTPRCRSPRRGPPTSSRSRGGLP